MWTMPATQMENAAGNEKSDMFWGKLRKNQPLKGRQFFSFLKLLYNNVPTYWSIFKLLWALTES